MKNVCLKQKIQWVGSTTEWRQQRNKTKNLKIDQSYPILRPEREKKRCLRNIYDNIKESYIGATGDPEEEKRGQKKYLKKYSRS